MHTASKQPAFGASPTGDHEIDRTQGSWSLNIMVGSKHSENKSTTQNSKLQFISHLKLDYQSCWVTLSIYNSDWKGWSVLDSDETSWSKRQCCRILRELSSQRKLGSIRKRSSGWFFVLKIVKIEVNESGESGESGVPKLSQGGRRRRR